MEQAVIGVKNPFRKAYWRKENPNNVFTKPFKGQIWRRYHSAWAYSADCRYFGAKTLSNLERIEHEVEHLDNMNQEKKDYTLGKLTGLTEKSSDAYEKLGRRMVLFTAFGVVILAGISAYSYLHAQILKGGAANTEKVGKASEMALSLAKDLAGKIELAAVVLAMAGVILIIEEVVHSFYRFNRFSLLKSRIDKIREKILNKSDVGG